MPTASLLRHAPLAPVARAPARRGPRRLHGHEPERVGRGLQGRRARRRPGDRRPEGLARARRDLLAVFTDALAKSLEADGHDCVDEVQATIRDVANTDMDV